MFGFFDYSNKDERNRAAERALETMYPQQFYTYTTRTTCLPPQKRKYDNAFYSRTRKFAVGKPYGM